MHIILAVAVVVLAVAIAVLTWRYKAEAEPVVAMVEAVVTDAKQDVVAGVTKTEQAVAAAQKVL
jgi:hypothetical protein